MIQKNRIKLSRSLRAQTTPYPNIKKLLGRGALFVIVLLILGVYVIARNSSPEKTNLAGEPEKQVLGEQQNTSIYQTYVVKEGDTLFNISTRYNIDWKKIVEVNKLEEPYSLKIGQEIKLPQ